MPSMTIVVPHQLTQDEAMSRIQNLLSEVKRDYGDRVSDLKETWSGNSGEVLVQGDGLLALRPDGRQAGRGRDEGELPAGGAVPFKGKIESMIRERAEQLLAS